MGVSLWMVFECFCYVIGFMCVPWLVILVLIGLESYSVLLIKLFCGLGSIVLLCALINALISTNACDSNNIQLILLLSLDLVFRALL